MRAKLWDDKSVKVYQKNIKKDKSVNGLNLLIVGSSELWRAELHGMLVVGEIF